MDNITSKVKILFKTGFFHIFGSGVINKIIIFLSSIVLVRILTKQEYGLFTYAWNIYSIILIMNGMGIESGSLQLSSEKGGENDYTQAVCNYGLKFGIKVDVLLALLIIGIGLFAPLKFERSRGLLCILFGLPMVQLMYQLTTTYLRSQKRNQEYARLTIINTLLIFLMSAAGAFILREKGLVLGYYVAYAASFLFGVICYNIRFLKSTNLLSTDDRSALLRISAITMVNNGLSQLMYLLDVFVLGIVDPEETILASYKVATMIPAALSFIPLALITYLYPYFAEHRNDGKWCLNRYKQILLGLGGFNLVLSLFLYITAPIMVRIMFGSQYLDAVPVFRILSLNYFISGTFRILSGNLLVTQRKLKFNLFVAVISSVINLIANFLFIQWWGSVGAAIATVLVVVISSILSTTYLVYTFKKNSL